MTDRCPQCAQDECDCSPEVVAEAARRAAAGEPPLVIASDAAQVVARAKKIDRADKQDAQDLNWLMRHPQGRRLMWDLLQVTGLFRNPAFDAGFDTNQTMFKAGQQNIGQYYLQRTVSMEPDGYHLMVKENSGSKT